MMGSDKEIRTERTRPALTTHQIASRLREQMHAFLGNLSASVPQKTARRFVCEGLQGILARKSLRLSEIVRSLNEPIPLIKTENRLSRQARRGGLADCLHDFVIRQSAHRIGRDTLLLVDPSDLVKPHAKKMEHLARVRDGSEGGLANGYWLCQVIAVECGGGHVTPLVNHLWSQDAPGHKSENAEVLSCIERVTHRVASRGIWVMDRGGDRMSIMRELLRKHRRFLIRLVGNRHLLYRGKMVLAEELAHRCPLPYREAVIKQKRDGTEERLELSFGMMRVRLPGFPKKELRLVVLHGFGSGPVMLLTTEALRPSRRSIQWALDAYLTRWRIEETLRYAKQTYGLEDVRVLSYQGLRNMMALALLAMSFTMTWLGMRERLIVLMRHALTAAKRFFGIPDFRYYAISDGLADILRRRQTPAFRAPPDLNQGGQLDIIGY